MHRIGLHALRHSHASLLIDMVGTYGHLYPNSNFEVAHKLNGIMSYQTVTENNDTSSKNQFTAHYLRKGLKTNNAIKVQLHLIKYLLLL